MRDVPKDCNQECNEVRHTTLRERLHYQVESSKQVIAREQDRIKEAEAILAKLKKNPELEAIVDFMQSGR